jgi:cobalt/nickel transport system ATP-binding protein
MPSTGAELAFRVDNVSFAYHGKQQALNDVSLEVAVGEQLVILGANGCGKSTLLRILDGLHKPTSGHVWAFGEDVTDAADDTDRARALHRRVGLVFQDPDVQLFCPTVYDDVAFGPLQLGWSEAEVRERVDRALAQMNVTQLADRAPYELSGGEKKRVAIASVLSMDPDAILLDEPTASLDPRSKSVLVEIIVGLRELGKTVIVTTHELDIVPTIATRVVVFGDQERRPVASGSAAEMLGDEALLLRANLIHEHLHWHGDTAHVHPHAHDGEHAHEDSSTSAPA